MALALTSVRRAGRLLAGWLTPLYVLWAALVIALSLFARGPMTAPPDATAEQTVAAANALDVFYGLIAMLAVATIASGAVLGCLLWALRKLRSPYPPKAKHYALTTLLPFTFLWMFPNDRDSR